MDTAEQIVKELTETEEEEQALEQVQESDVMDRVEIIADEIEDMVERGELTRDELMEEIQMSADQSYAALVGTGRLDSLSATPDRRRDIENLKDAITILDTAQEENADRYEPLGYDGQAAIHSMAIQSLQELIRQELEDRGIDVR